MEREPTLTQFLAARARQASDARLALDVGAGFLVVLAASIWRGKGWDVAATAGLCVLAYGVWGITDRELGERGKTGYASGSLRAGRIAAATIGVVAAVGFALSALAIILGPIKS